MFVGWSSLHCLSTLFTVYDDKLAVLLMLIEIFQIHFLSTLLVSWTLDHFQITFTNVISQLFSRLHLVTLGTSLSDEITSLLMRFNQLLCCLKPTIIESNTFNHLKSTFFFMYLNIVMSNKLFATIYFIYTGNQQLVE